MTCPVVQEGAYGLCQQKGAGYGQQLAESGPIDLAVSAAALSAASLPSGWQEMWSTTPRRG